MARLQIPKPSAFIEGFCQSAGVSSEILKTLLTGFMPCKPRFVSGVKRHVSESIKLNPGKPRLVAGSFTLSKRLSRCSWVKTP